MKITLNKDRAKLIAQELNEAAEINGCSEVIVTIEEAENSYAVCIQPVLDPVKIMCVK